MDCHPDMRTTFLSGNSVKAVENVNIVLVLLLKFYTIAVRNNLNRRKMLSRVRFYNLKHVLCADFVGVNGLNGGIDCYLM